MRTFTVIAMMCLYICCGWAQTQMLEERGGLRISSVPAGCTVLVDSRIAGTTPVTIDTLEQGKYIVAVLKDGFCTALDTIECAGRRLTEHAVVLDPECILNAESEPAGAAIYLNGVFHGVTPVRIGQLKSGRYGVMAMRRDFERWTDTVQLAAASPVHVKATLKTLPAAVTILAPDDSVEVFINNVSTGFGSRQDLTVPAGVVSIRVWQRSTDEMVEENFYLPPAGRRTMRADFGRPTRSAFWYSLLCPGLGQFMNGARVKGVAIGTAFFAALIGTINRDSDFRSKEAELDRAVLDYRKANYSSDAIELRRVIQSAYDGTNSALRTRNLLLAIAVGVYTASALDAWFFHDDITELVTIESPSLTFRNDQPVPSLSDVTVTMRVPL